jgi:hypothetical protein
MRSWLCLLLAATLPHAFSANAAKVSGRVFLDTNENGAFDPSEPPVAACLVSDGFSLHRTDSAGRFVINVPAGPGTVFVINPPGTWPRNNWWVPLTNGGREITVDFPLQPARQEGPFHLVHGTDIHLRPDVVSLYQRYLDHVNRLPVPVSVVVHTGDLVVDALQSSPKDAAGLFDLYNSISRRLKPALRNLPGNHDVVAVGNPGVSPSVPGYGKALYREKVGPIHYAFRHGAWHFIALDCSTVAARAVRSGLTKESADWAIQYLGTVGTNEPIVLLTHQPLYPEINGEPDLDPTAMKGRPHEERLLAALKGKRLRLTLAGHVHNRGDTRWGGAPHALGGAVSYAWHGLLPHPNTPRGYALYRLDDQRSERVFLDWAEERSIDITSPRHTEVLVARQVVRGSVADFSGDITAVEVALGGMRFSARTNRPGTLATGFAAEVDASMLADGVYDLVVTARAGTKSWQEVQPVVVFNALPETLRSASPAKLTFTLSGETSSAGRVMVNGRAVGELPAGKQRGRLLSFTVPAERLRRLNEIRIEAGLSEDWSQPVTIRGLALEWEGKTLRDVRYSPQAPRALQFGQNNRPAFLISYVDLTYPDPFWKSTPAARAK